MGIRLEEYQAASSLAVQWLRLRLPKQGVQVRLVVFELRSHMPWGQKNKTKKQYCNKFSIKWSTSKKKKEQSWALSWRDVWLKGTQWWADRKWGDRLGGLRQ